MMARWMTEMNDKVILKNELENNSNSINIFQLLTRVYQELSGITVDYKNLSWG